MMLLLCLYMQALGRSFYLEQPTTFAHHLFMETLMQDLVKLPTSRGCCCVCVCVCLCVCVCVCVCVRLFSFLSNSSIKGMGDEGHGEIPRCVIVSLWGE